MTPLVLALVAFCVAVLILHLASIIIVVIRVRRGVRRLPPTDAGVSIIRPVCGLENFSEATLRSSFRLAHPRYEILFCVAKANDPIIPIVSRLIEAHPQIPAQLLVGNDRMSDNPKLNNVAKGWAAAGHAWIVMADSNVLMPSDYLQRLLATWQPDTGLVSSPAIGCRPDGVWAELECGFMNTYQARWQCFVDAMGVGFAQGKTMLYRREIIDAAGGLSALASELAEDAASTKVVRSLGLRVRVLDRPIMQPLGRRSVSEVWQRQLRWARLRRGTFTLYFIPELLAGSVPPLAACAAIAASGDWPLAGPLVGFAAVWYGAEALLAAVAGWHLSWRSPFLWLLRDFLLPVLWVASWVRNDFVWRDNPMRVARRGSAA